MKKYVFLTFAVHGIGGTQIYIRNKLIFLKKYGWDVNVITSELGNNIMVKELAPYANDIVPEIAKNPGLCSKRERENALQRMIEIVGKSSDIIFIETNFMGATPWGEMLAERLKAHHLILLIQENYNLKAPKYQKFFAWKYDRNELVGNTPNAIPQLLNGYRNVSLEISPVLIPYCHNVIEDVKSPELEKLIFDADIHIGSIGRLNKPFVLPMVKKLEKFVSKYPEKKFQLILFGGSDNNQDIKNIQSYQRNNFQIAITGPIFPIPLYLIQKMDIFIASAGAARTSYEAGGITIAIDANDFEPIGILGRDTQKVISRDVNSPRYSLEELLTQVLFSNTNFKKPKVVQKDIDAEFMKHLEFLSNMDKQHIYYNIRKIWPSFLSRLIYRLNH